jgi:hypothetical protein
MNNSKREGQTLLNLIPNGLEHFSRVLAEKQGFGKQWVYPPYRVQIRELMRISLVF